MKMLLPLKPIRKIDKVHATNGTIVDSLDSNSKSNAPSIFSVNKGLNDIKKSLTSIKLNGVIQENLSIVTEREEKPIYASVQIIDKDGNVLAFETSLSNVFIKSKDGTSEASAETIFTNLYALASSALYTSNPKSIFDELEKFF